MAEAARRLSVRIGNVSTWQPDQAIAACAGRNSSSGLKPISIPVAMAMRQRPPGLGVA